MGVGVIFSSAGEGRENFLRRGPRSRSEITWRRMSRSIGFCCRALPSDRALKQRLLILRGMPSLHWAMMRQRVFGKQRSIEGVAGSAQPVAYILCCLFGGEGFEASEYGNPLP